MFSKLGEKLKNFAMRSNSENFVFSNGRILAREVVCLGVIATIAIAITTIGILGILGIIPISFSIMNVVVTTTTFGGVFVGIGGISLLITLYGICFVIQRNVDRSSRERLLLEPV
ncbi:MAG: hypothetical protein KDK55_07205 [Chlamydiia bacterium]|nr:hypothetical protein [Chlamydiia bacterium]